MNRPQALAIWLTGLPASGKSTIVTALIPQLENLGRPIEVLESDAVRRILTPAPTYSQAERDLFYRALAFMGARLVVHGVTVIFDATANRRAYRDFARSLIPRAEVLTRVAAAQLQRSDRSLAQGVSPGYRNT